MAFPSPDIDTLRALTRALSTPWPNSQDAARAGLKVLVEHFGADGGWLRGAPHVDDADDGLPMMASVGPPPPARVKMTPAEQRRQADGAVLHFRLPDEVTGPGTRHWAELGFRSVCVAPVVVETQRLGALALLFRHSAPSNISATLSAAGPLIAACLQSAHLGEMCCDTRQLVKNICCFVEFRDLETRGHTERVRDLAVSFGTYLNLGTPELKDLSWSAYLHDVGKLGVAPQILLKPGPLTAQERAIMSGHSEMGVAIVGELKGVAPAVLGVVRHHHERWDGAGYPGGLAGDAIPLLARVFALVDVHDALRSERVYKSAWPDKEIHAEFARQAGKQFDPELTKRFLDFLRA